MNIDPSQVDTLIRSRRSVFPEQYTGENVPREVVRKMIENACYAPSHKLTQPWRFVVFEGEGVKRLAEEQAEVYRNVTMKNDTYREDKYQSLLSKPLLASHVIAVCMKRDEKRSVPEIEEMGAVFCAVENMYITAVAYGVGCYLSTGGVTYFPEAKELFQLGPDDKLIGFLYVGIPKKTTPPLKRKSLEEVAVWIGKDAQDQRSMGG